MSEKDEAMKVAVKEALKEWLDDRWTRYTSSLGKWVLGIVAAGVLAGLVYFVMWANGWRQP